MSDAKTQTQEGDGKPWEGEAQAMAKRATSAERIAELQAATDRAAILIEARRLLRETLKDLPKAQPEKAPFWDRESTEQALRELDVWASVHKARAEDIYKVPTFDAIFERPRRIAADYRDFDTGLRDAHPLPGDPEGLEEMAPVAKAAPKSAELVLYLSVNGALKADGLLIYGRVLLHYLPRKGAYQADAVIEPGFMRRTDQDILREAVHAIRNSWRRR